MKLLLTIFCNCSLPNAGLFLIDEPLERIKATSDRSLISCDTRISNQRQANQQQNDKHYIEKTATLTRLDFVAYLELFSLIKSVIVRNLRAYPLP